MFRTLALLVRDAGTLADAGNLSGIAPSNISAAIPRSAAAA
jgi:hypothetical protein